MSLLDPPPVTAAGLDQAAADLFNDPDSALRGAGNATYALKTDLASNLDGGNASSVYTGTFNFDGGSAA